MKLILAVIQNRDADVAVDALTKASYVVTRMASTGGFLLEGNTTLLVGVEDAQFEKAVNILRQHCHRRVRVKAVPIAGIDTGVGHHGYIEVEVGGATVFVLDVEHFERIG